MTTTLPCSVCDAAPEHAILLDDQTTYCPIHRGPWGAHAVGPHNVPGDDEAPDYEVPITVGPLPHAAEDTVDIAAVKTPDADLPPVGEGAAGGASPVEASDSDQAEAPETVTAPPAADPEGGPNIPALKLLIGLILGAGVNSLDKNNNPLEPPTGFLPPPADQVPEVAGACALAVALMIRTFGIAHEDVMALARQFLDTDNEGETE